MRRNELPECLRRLSYWRHGNAERARTRHRTPSGSTHYLTFEIDNGGFNNIRQAFEYAVIIAALTDRVLVLPPPSRWYLINFGPMEREGEPGGVSSIGDFFDVTDVGRYVPLMSAPEFTDLERRRLDIPDEFFDPIHARDSSDAGYWVEAGRRWNLWLRTRMRQIPWNPLNNVIFWPDIQSVLDGRCSPVTAFMDGRVAVEFDDTMNGQPVLHLPCDPARGARHLGQMSTAVAFEDFSGSVRLRSLLRNGVHYVPEVFDTASRLIDRMGLFGYAAVHIRRNDFQYEETKIGGGGIAANVDPLLRSDETLYVATDEADAGFLDELRGKRPVVTWPDLVRGIPELNVPPRLVACVEQVICAGARIFIGTKFSTMSSYVVRLRGYIDAPNTGTYYHTDALDDELLADHTIRPVSGREYMREDERLWQCSGDENDSFYSLVCTDTRANVHWQCEMLEHTWRSVRQRGELVRLVAAGETEEIPDHSWATVIRTAYTNVDPASGDDYPPYNRLYSLKQWLEEYSPRGTVLILDPDCVFRGPVDGLVRPGSPKAQLWVDCPSWSVTSRFVAALEDVSIATTADLQRITWPALIHTGDLERLLPRWIELTREYRQRTRAWESDMVAFVVASAEIGLNYTPSNLAAWMNWPEETVKGAPIIHYCQKIEDPEGRCLWSKHDYQPWQPIAAAPARANLDYCRDLLSIVRRYAAWRRAAGGIRCNAPQRLDVRIHLRGRTPISLQCGYGARVLSGLVEAMEPNTGEDQTTTLDFEDGEGIQFVRSDLTAVEIAPLMEESGPAAEAGDLVEVDVKIAEVGTFSLVSEDRNPAVAELRNAVTANENGAPDEMMFLQTGQAERVYFLRSALESVDVGEDDR